MSPSTGKPSKLLSLTSQSTPQMGTAVLYLRVSTREQAERGGEAEGFSIPAQREACLRKAQSLGVIVVGEFTDAGESARSSRRPQLQAMLRYLEDNPAQFVIVHKIDRLARNRADDVAINMAIQRSGATLVSVTENIDQTPSGRLLHGIMSDIAEFYSANLAHEVMKGLHQKARGGGTIGKAPIGYLNIRTYENGVEKRTVQFDPDRAELMRWAFSAYASGEWTLISLNRELTERGLTTVPGPKTPSKSLSVSQLHRFLRHPYYTGKVLYGGVLYDGQHEALVPEAVWQRVQDIMDSRNREGEKQRRHNHYLKSTVVCLGCGSRLIVSINTNRYGQSYPYFVCLGRHQKRTTCTQKAIRIEKVEVQVEEQYAEQPITSQEAEDLRRYLHDEFALILSTRQAETDQLARDKQRLEHEQLKLLQSHYADAIPLDLLKKEQTRISNQLSAIERRLTRNENQLSTLSVNLDRALSFLTNLHETYEAADERTKRQLNQAYWEHVAIGDDDAAGQPQPLYAALRAPEIRTASRFYARTVPGSSRTYRDVQTRPRTRKRASQNGTPDASLGQMHPFLIAARRAGGVKETQLA
ncbi:MAG: recombinase family protein, partial [Tetrasphaera sp.]